MAAPTPTPRSAATEAWLAGAMAFSTRNKQPGQPGAYAKSLARTFSDMSQPQAAARPSARGSVSSAMEDDEEAQEADDAYENLLRAADEEDELLKAEEAAAQEAEERAQEAGEADDAYESRMAAMDVRLSMPPPRPSSSLPGQNPPPPPPYPQCFQLTPEVVEVMDEEEEVDTRPFRDFGAQPPDFEGMPDRATELPSYNESYFHHRQWDDRRCEYEIAVIVSDQLKAWQDCHNDMEPLGCNGCLCYYTIYSEVVGL
jgi:hypothetical protein